MDHFNYKNGVLFAEDVDLRAIANAVSTPCYVYSRATLERHWHAFDSVFADYPHLLCYSVKSNSSLAVLNLMARLDSGFDIVSIGELHRVIRAGGDAAKTVFSGVGKTAEEMREALEIGIYCFNVESEAELDLLSRVAAAAGKTARVSLRVNPDVDAKTHPYISTGLKSNKFGIAATNVEAVYARAMSLPGIEVSGVDCHIGSQLCELSPFVDALDRVMALVDVLKRNGINISHIDVGGGLGVRYKDETPPQPAQYAEAVLSRLKDSGLRIIIEPGRAITANAGILLTKLLYIKEGEEKHFAIVDAAMNDLIRPTLYQAWQEIIAVEPRRDGEPQLMDVVGPICESGDFLGKDRLLNVKADDLLAIRSAGAYGFSMSSNYNTRPRAAEVMVDGSNYHVIRRRETIEELFSLESLLP